MKPEDVCNHIVEDFNVYCVYHSTDSHGRHRFHISVSEDINFDSYYTYCDEQFERAIDDIAAVLIKMGLERDKPCLPRKEPDGHPVTLADSANILKQLYPMDKDMLASYAPKLERFARLCKKREVTDSNKEEPTSDDGPTLDEEFPVQPNGFRFL